MKDKIQIGDRWIGVDQPTFIVAEIGSNHDRKIDQAKQHIEAAAKNGADAVKFQLYTAEDLYPKNSPVYSAVKATELPPEWLPDLARYSAQCGIMFLSSPFSYAAVEALAEVNVPAYKWASSEMVKLDLLKYAAAQGKPMLLSTGMCDLADVHEAIEVVCAEGNTDIIILQCTSLYPTPPNKVHLRAMDTLRSAFCLPVGLSDHTLEITVPVAAVARGACLIEKHLTIDRGLSGPDHNYALEPNEFKKMVKAIRDTEQALGSLSKMMLPEEAQFARRDSVRAACDIAAHEVIKPNMLLFDRPGDGIRPRFMRALFGQKTKRSIAKGEAITWNSIKSPK